MAVLLLAACQGEGTDVETPGEGTPVPVTLGVRSHSASTRATGTPEGPEFDIEKIHTWWVVLVNQKNVVVKIITRPAGRTSYVEQEQVETEIPKGIYTIYSFANITQEELKMQTSLSFTEGGTCPDVDAATLTLLQDWNKGKDIPMTGKQKAQVIGRMNEVLDIEVVRMLAKMDIQFANESSRAVTIKSLKMSQSATDQVPLLPNYTYLEVGMPEPTATGMVRDYTRTYASGNKLVAFTPGSTPAMMRDVFYVRESQADYNPTHRYLMAVTMERDGAGASEQLFAFTRELYSIYRNDHIVIPVMLSDYRVRVRALFYPPIGGYPAVLVTENDETFSCEFGTEGDFEIYPTIEDTQAGNSLVYGTGDPHYTLAITSVSDPSHILEKAPTLANTTGEVTGRLSTATGTAWLDVRITVHRQGAADQVYERRIYLVRK